MKLPFLSCAVVACLLQLFVSAASGTPSNDPDIAARRGKVMTGQGAGMPVLMPARPEGGWNTSLQLEVAGTCKAGVVKASASAILRDAYRQAETK